MVKNLKKLRQLRGISQQQLADVIMVSQQSVNKYENHDVEPNVETLIKIADYFNVSVDYLIGRIDSEDKEKILNLNNVENKLIIEFRKLKEKQKNCVISIVDSYK